MPQVAFTLIPHESQVYVAMFISNQLVILDFCIFYLKGVFFASNFLQIFFKFLLNLTVNCRMDAS